MKRTKIICTIGPASEKEPTLYKMIKSGMNVARLNFSHGTYKHHKMLMKNIRLASKKAKQPIAILQDLQGPRIRVGKLPKEGVPLKKNKEYLFTTDVKYKDKYNNDKIFVTYNNLHKDLKKDEIILLKDGLIKVKVISIRGKDFKVKVLIPGVIESNKGMNFPNTKLKISPITKKDIKDLEFGIKQNIDWVAISFVSSAKDIITLRKLIQKFEKKLKIKNKYPIKIIPKIEKAPAVENIDEIIDVSDGIMIARGDLGIELPPQKVPLHQKMIIEKSRKKAKPVVVATQMLESMMSNSRPTRAEVSDIANAVIDHTDAVMLSGETAGGKYPVESVKVMSDTIISTEESKFDDLEFDARLDQEIVTFHQSMGLVCGAIAASKKINAIFVASLSGKSAQFISRYRPELPIIMCTINDRVMRQLTLSWGVIPCITKEYEDSKSMIKEELKKLIKDGFIKKGDNILFVIGYKVGKKGSPNIIKIVRY